MIDKDPAMPGKEILICGWPSLMRQFVIAVSTCLLEKDGVSQMPVLSLANGVTLDKPIFDLTTLSSPGRLICNDIQGHEAQINTYVMCLVHIGIQ